MDDFLNRISDSHVKYKFNLDAIIKKYDREFPESDIVDLSLMKVVKHNGHLSKQSFRRVPFGSSVLAVASSSKCNSSLLSGVDNHDVDGRETFSMTSCEDKTKRWENVLDITDVTAVESLLATVNSLEDDSDGETLSSTSSDDYVTDEEIEDHCQNSSVTNSMAGHGYSRENWLKTDNDVKIDKSCGNSSDGSTHSFPSLKSKDTLRVRNNFHIVNDNYSDLNKTYVLTDSVSETLPSSHPSRTESGLGDSNSSSSETAYGKKVIDANPTCPFDDQYHQSTGKINNYWSMETLRKNNTPKGKIFTPESNKVRQTSSLTPQLEKLSVCSKRTPIKACVKKEMCTIKKNPRVQSLDESGETLCQPSSDNVQEQTFQSTFNNSSDSSSSSNDVTLIDDTLPEDNDKWLHVINSDIISEWVKYKSNSKVENWLNNIESPQSRVRDQQTYNSVHLGHGKPNKLSPKSLFVDQLPIDLSKPKNMCSTSNSVNLVCPKSSVTGNLDSKVGLHKSSVFNFQETAVDLTVKAQSNKDIHVQGNTKFRNVTSSKCVMDLSKPKMKFASNLIEESHGVGNGNVPVAFAAHVRQNIIANTRKHVPPFKTPAVKFTVSTCTSENSGRKMKNMNAFNETPQNACIETSTITSKQGNITRMVHTTLENKHLFDPKSRTRQQISQKSPSVFDQHVNTNETPLAANQPSLHKTRISSYVINAEENGNNARDKLYQHEFNNRLIPVAIVTSTPAKKENNINIPSDVSAIVPIYRKMTRQKCLPNDMQFPSICTLKHTKNGYQFLEEEKYEHQSINNRQVKRKLDHLTVKPVKRQCTSSGGSCDTSRDNTSCDERFKEHNTSSSASGKSLQAAKKRKSINKSSVKPKLPSKYCSSTCSANECRNKFCFLCD